MNETEHIVNYFGRPIKKLKRHRYVATDKDGTIATYKDTPVTWINDWGPLGINYRRVVSTPNIEFDGWKSTLLEYNEDCIVVGTPKGYHNVLFCNINVVKKIEHKFLATEIGSVHISSYKTNPKIFTTGWDTNCDLEDVGGLGTPSTHKTISIYDKHGRDVNDIHYKSFDCLVKELNSSVIVNDEANIKESCNLKLNDKYHTVSYLGHPIIKLKIHNYIATSSYGNTYSYADKPIPLGLGFWNSLHTNIKPDYITDKYVCENWENSLVEYPEYSESYFVSWNVSSEDLLRGLNEPTRTR